MKIKVPFALVMLVASLVLTFVAPQGAAVVMEPTGGLAGVVSLILKVGPIALLVLGVAALFVKGRVVPEVAAVVCYAMGAAFMLRALSNVMLLKEIVDNFEGDIEMVMQAVSVAPTICLLISGWLAFLVAARIQDDETVGSHGALGTVGCLLVFVTGGVATAGGYSIFEVIPMLLQIGYLKRLPTAFAYTKGVTTVKNILYVVVLLALYFAGPQLLMGI